MLTEKDIMEARNSRYGRRRSQSIDYGSQGRGKSGFEQTPEQALYSHSCQILKTIPRFQYEAPSWVPNLLKVQDTQEERNAEVVLLFLFLCRMFLNINTIRSPLKLTESSTRNIAPFVLPF